MQTATTFFALLTLAANVGTALWLVSVVGGERTRALRATVEANAAPVAMILALVVAAASMGGSLYYSESVGLEPCLLCWYQRIAMYPLVAIFAVGIWRRDPSAWRFAMPLVIIGGLIAGYHYLIQQVPSLDAGTCSARVPCSSAYFFRFGFISIPYMALSGFAAIAALWWISRSERA